MADKTAPRKNTDAPEQKKREAPYIYVYHRGEVIWDAYHYRFFGVNEEVATNDGDRAVSVTAGTLFGSRPPETVTVPVKLLTRRAGNARPRA